jgi:hypothetical protein
MEWTTEPPDAVRLGLRSIDGAPGVALVGEASLADDGKWEVPFSLTLDGLGDVGGIERTTHWTLRIPPNYPLGVIDILPAKIGGIRGTFPHQSANEPTRPIGPGRICVGMHDAVLGRLAKVPEPPTAASRLRWHLERARAWVLAASRDELRSPGDPFELPDFHPGVDLVAFAENGPSLETWMRPETGISGFVDLRYERRRPSRVGYKRFVASFREADGRVIRDSPWGTYLPEPTVPARGFWLRLPGVPVVQPWAAIRTWGELREAFRTVGNDFDELVAPLIRELRPGTGRKHRKRARRLSPTRVGLLGFPIPSLVGGPLVQMHWQAFEIPPLTEGTTRAVPGYRPTERNLRAIDQRDVFGGARSIKWLRSENWDLSQISSRGSLAPGARGHRLLVIGAGTLGSLVAEALVRLGMRDVLVLDPDFLRGGNLVRHTLTVAEVDEAKALVLADRLAATHPSVRARGFLGSFSSVPEDIRVLVSECDVVLDTTGSDDVIGALGEQAWTDPVTFISISLAADALKLFAYARRGLSFDASGFWAWFGPIGEAERTRTPESPMEGAGCWHPVMPARWDRILVLAGLVVPWIEKCLAQEMTAARSAVIDVPAAP